MIVYIINRIHLVMEHLQQYIKYKEKEMNKYMQQKLYIKICLMKIDIKINLL